jgi:uncharacterized protein YdaU (DUF1376 family)
MNGLPYYKAYPRDFIEGTIGMDFEMKGAYRLVLDLIYMQGGKLPDDARYISGLLGCSVRKWKSLRNALIDMNKLDVFEGAISNKVARKQLESLRKVQEKNSENGAKSNKNKDLQNRTLNHTEPEPYIEKEEPKGSKKKPEKKPDHVQVKENLSAVIGEDLAQAVFDHRKKINKPLTPRAATMLANKFGQCMDPMAAAEAMISNGWQGFEPEWLERMQATSRNGAYGMADAYLKSEARQPVQTDMLAVENPMTGELEYYPQ